MLPAVKVPKELLQVRPTVLEVGLARRRRAAILDAVPTHWAGN
jgi:hypothetical protein